MKKIIFGIAFLAFIIALYVSFQEKAIGVNDSEQHAVFQGITEEVFTIKEQGKPAKIGGSTFGNASEQCQNYIEQNAGHFDDFMQKMDFHFTSGLEDANAGPYSTLPPEDLQLLAEGKDLQAMHFHGANLVWEGAIGIKAFYNDEFYQRPSNEQLKKHKMDIEKMERGQNLLWEAAVRGRVGSLLETTMFSHFIINKHSTGKLNDPDLLKEHIARYAAVKQLNREILESSSFVGWLVSKPEKQMKLEDDIRHKIQAVESKLPGVYELEDKDILGRAENYLKEKRQLWKLEAEYYGNDPRPKIFDIKDAKFAKELDINCFANDGIFENNL